MCPDPVNKRELEFLSKAANGRPIFFDEFWAKLVDRYSDDVNGCARIKMKELKIDDTGRVGLPIGEISKQNSSTFGLTSRA